MLSRMNTTYLRLRIDYKRKVQAREMLIEVTFMRLLGTSARSGRITDVGLSRQIGTPSNTL